ncbi:ammonia-forming cytochrome c nitrite reductase subunit c552 [Propionimicrobium sp. PCR01-08-3]|uniref:ammonia-forming cytochrome c nitrite reductase subunit c552 n=1 Tax=Propionimicrobium sp. PCR01-08-3 TaxID=3052086 RepID=UPI00255CCB1B|nr:ammonia-forming cytochrome c nitrite reductase subunit c552 [Propionimicrobium sp. PCR01-08-3]WIY82974.1 ammonia-forming cytochrome c nitrite reductase subunit c552 [Propionimicrobium sp. PCR01-08-3]
MSTDKTNSNASADDKPSGATRWTGPGKRWVPIVVLIACVVAAAGLTWLLTTIFTHKQESKQPFTQVVEITDTTYDPAVWGQNYPLQYESYLQTSEMDEADKVAHEPTDQDPRLFVTHSKLETYPRLVNMWQGYAFSVDYREPRGHEYMLTDQQYTRRMLEFDQPGACLNCHASLPEVMDDLGDGDQMAGWAAMNKMPYSEAVQHASGPIACIDCHDPQTMELRVTRPAFIEGIKEYMASQGVEDYDVNEDASTQDMRAYVCAQCHVEYYFAGDEKTLTFPWDHGLTAQDAIQYYDEIGWTDFTHADTGAPVLKAQHPDFETWSQGIHADNGVTCADCHMAYNRDGAAKVSDHDVTSPMSSEESINASCLTCHHSTAAEMQERVDTIQNRWYEAQDISFAAFDEFIADLSTAVDEGTATDEQLEIARDYQRRASFLIDYTISENSKGFHAPAYSISILNQATDYSRKGQLVLRGVDVDPATGPVSSATPSPER